MTTHDAHPAALRRATIRRPRRSEAPHAGRARAAERGHGARPQGGPAHEPRGVGLRTATRPDPVTLLQSQEETRVAELVPLRHERMLVSPFTFYRGAAIVMASDLVDHARPPTSRCSSAATRTSPTSAGSPHPTARWCSTSTTSTRRRPGRSSGTSSASPPASRSRRATTAFTPKKARECVLERPRAHTASAMAEFAAMTNLAGLVRPRRRRRRFSTAGAPRSAPPTSKRMRGMIAKAQAKDSTKALTKLTGASTATPTGSRAIPPVVVPIDELARRAGHRDGEDELVEWLHEQVPAYRHSLQPDRRHLLDGYELVDFARKVVGVGSVGTRCWIALFLGRDDAATRSSSRSRRRRRRCSRPTRAGAGTPTTVSGSWRASACSRRRATSLLGWLHADGLDGVEPRLLRAPALGLEALGRHRHHDARDA